MDESTTVEASADVAEKISEELDKDKSDIETDEGVIQEAAIKDTDYIQIDQASHEQTENVEVDPAVTENVEVDPYVTENVEVDPAVTENVAVDPAMIEKLTHGVLNMFLPNLQKAKGALHDLLHNQEVLIETIQQENAKFTDSAAVKQLVLTMHEAKMYHGKLVNLKKEMNFLMEKSTKLKHRAVKLQQQKQKEELTRAAQHERELERERMLTAKVAKRPGKENQS